MTFLPQPDFAVTATEAVVLAQQPGTNDEPGEEEFGKSSPVALVVLILFAIAVVLLIRSMTKHLKRVPPSFETSDDAEPADTQNAPAEPADAQNAPESDREKPAGNGDR